MYPQKIYRQKGQRLFYAPAQDLQGGKHHNPLWQVMPAFLLQWALSDTWAYQKICWGHGWGRQFHNPLKSHFQRGLG